MRRQEVAARDHELATRTDRIDPIDARQPRHHVQMLGLDERELRCGEFRLAALAEAIVRESDASESHGACHLTRCLAR